MRRRRSKETFEWKLIVLFLILQIQQEAIDMPEFEQRMLPVLIDMAEDKVPNVRLVVGKCLYKCAQSGE